MAEKAKRKIKAFPLISWILFGALSTLIIVESATPSDSSGVQSWSLTRVLANFFNSILPGEKTTTAKPTGINISAYSPSADFGDGQRKNLFEANEAIIGTTKLFQYTLNYDVENANIYDYDVQLKFTKSPGKDSFSHTFTTSKTGGVLRIIPLKEGEFEFTLTDSASHVSTFSFNATKRIKPKDISAKTDLISLKKGEVSRLDYVMTFGDLKRDDGTVDHYLARYYNRSLVEFSSSNESVVKVENGGILKAVGPGNANILYEGKTLCPVTVSNEAFHSDVARIALTCDNTNISPLDYDYYYGGQIDVHYYDGDDHELDLDLPVDFSCSNDLVALVDNDHLDFDEKGSLYREAGGYVSGYREEGTATITAKLLQDPSISSTIDFTSSPVLPTSVTIHVTNGNEEIMTSGSSVKAGGTLTITPELEPKNASSTAIHVDINDESLAKVLNNDTNNPSISLIKEGKLEFDIYSVPLGKATAKHYSLTIEPKPHIDDSNISDFHSFIRKAAGHFSLFFITGIFGAMAMFSSLFLDKKKRYLITSGVALGSGLALAGISELIQTIPALARGGSIVDVGIDFLGFAIGVGLTLCVFLLVDYLRKKKASKSEEPQA